ncbi:MAG TPA: thioredoxin family protein [Lacipirellulaceae bacterium]
MRALAVAMIAVALLTLCAEPGVLAQSASTSARAADRKKADDKFSVGDPAPAFEGLVGTDDKQHSLEEFKEAKAVALVFTCNQCPVAKAYEDRLNALQKDYADKDVQVVAINVNNAEAEKLPAMKERAEEKGFEFPYLADPTQKVGRNYGAKVTPHVFLLDAKRNLVFVGPVDDSQDERKVKRKYLREAIDAVLAGKKPEAAEVKPFGCGISYE